MDIEEAKHILLNVVADEVVGVYCQEIQKTTNCAKNCENDDCFVVRAIETVVKELELKDKAIDWLVEEIHTIVNLGEFIDNNINKLDTKEEIKEWCTNKVKLQSNKQSQ